MSTPSGRSEFIATVVAAARSLPSIVSTRRGRHQRALAASGVVAAEVGPDLVLVYVPPSDELPTADAQQRAATHPLADFLATYP